jgi:hypothetical protein
LNHKQKESTQTFSIQATDPTSIMTHEQVEGVKIQNAAISNVHVQNLNAKKLSRSIQHLQTQD